MGNENGCCEMIVLVYSGKPDTNVSGFCFCVKMLYTKIIVKNFLTYKISGILIMNSVNISRNRRENNGEKSSDEEMYERNFRNIRNKTALY